MNRDYNDAMKVYIDGLDIEISQNEKFISELKEDITRSEKEIEFLILRIANAEEKNQIAKERKEEAIKELV